MLKGIQVALMLALSVVLARSLGAEGYGVYAYAFALTELLGLPGQMGLQTLVVREIARFREREDWSRLRGALWFGIMAIVVSSTAIIVFAILITWLRRASFSHVQFLTLLWAFALLPFVSLLRLCGAALRGLQEIVRGLLPESVLLPGGFLVLLGVALMEFGTSGLTPDRAMQLHVIAAFAALVVGAFMLGRRMPDAARDVPIAIEARSWMAATIPLTLITGMQVVNSRADIIMIGLFGDPGQVGVYRVVVDTSLLVLFGLKAINTAVAPHFAALWSSHDLGRLQRLVTIVARISLGLALPAAVLLLSFGRPILSLIFGSEYASGALALGITVVGQVINASFGSIALLLNMTGHERIVIRGLTVAALANVGLNFLLIPRFGIEGAAFATVVTLTLWNVSLWVAARRQLNIDSLALRRLAATRSAKGD